VDMTRDMRELGMEAVDWLLNNTTINQTRQEARSIGQLLMDQGFVLAPHSGTLGSSALPSASGAPTSSFKQRFTDDNSLYIFVRWNDARTH